MLACLFRPQTSLFIERVDCHSYGIVGLHTPGFQRKMAAVMRNSDQIEDGMTVGTSLKKRAMTGAVWMSIEMAGVQGTSFLVFAILAHFVEPRDFGLMSICFLTVQSLQMLILYNVSTVAVRKRQTIDLDFTTAFWMTIGFSIVVFLGLFFAASEAERFFHAPGLAPVLRAMSVVLLFMGASRTHETWLIRHFHFKSLAIRGLAGALAGGVVGVILAINGYGVVALVGQQIANSVVSTLLLWAVCPWRPAFQFSMTTAREILMFMRSILPNSLVYTINQNCDTFLVALFFGPLNAGFYNIGKRIRLALQLVAGEPIKNIALPALAEIQDDPERLRRGVLRLLCIVCVTCAPVFFGAAAVSHEAILLVFGSKWIASGPVMQLLCVGGLGVVLLAYNDNIFILKDRPIWCLYVSLAYSVLACASVFVCAKLQVTSLALPFVLPYLLVFPLSATLIANRISLSFQQVSGALLPGIGAAAVMLLGLQLVGHVIPLSGELLRLLILVCAGGAIYLLVLGTVWPETVKEIIALLAHFGRRRLDQK